MRRTGAQDRSWPTGTSAKGGGLGTEAHQGVVSSREDPLGGWRRTPAASMARWSRTGRCGDLPVVWAPRKGVTLRCEHNRGSERAETCRRRGNCSELRAYRSWGSARFRRCSDLGPTQRIRRASWFFSGAKAGVVGARVAAEQCGRGGAGERRHGGAKSLRRLGLRVRVGGR